MTATILQFKPRADGSVTTKAINKVDEITKAGVFQARRRRQELDKKEAELDRELNMWMELLSDDYPYHK